MLLENVACNSAASCSRFEVGTLILCGFRWLLKCMLRELHARFWGARCFLTHLHYRLGDPGISLNAPFGARCFLTPSGCRPWTARVRLNAPFGARCFLTEGEGTLAGETVISLNAPFGARCFLTCDARGCCEPSPPVLMHLLALGAF